jgi:hypothetical protein
METKQKVDEAIEMILNNGSIDGGHHKMWLLDQILRMLLEDEYDAVIKRFENDGEFYWDTGIAP